MIDCTLSFSKAAQRPAIVRIASARTTLRGWRRVVEDGFDGCWKGYWEEHEYVTDCLDCTNSAMKNALSLH